MRNTLTETRGAKYLIIILAIPFSLLVWLHEADAGTAHYVDCSAGTNGSGTYASPWNVISSVNSHSFSTGDDVYFKVNTTCTPGLRLDIDWDGSDVDQVIIGAYYGDGLFGLNGNTRPIIDGNLTYPGTESGLIRYKNGTGYVTIKDIHVKDVAGYGIELAYDYTAEGYHTDYNTVENCYTQNTTYQGIIVYRAHYNVIEDNIVERASYNRSPGAGIEITGVGSETATMYNEARRNEVYWCYEGIGNYKGARYTIFEHNVSYDNRSYHIYVANSRNATVRYNLAFESTTDFDSSRDKLIGVNCEGHLPDSFKAISDHKIYGNLAAGGSEGIYILNNCDDLTPVIGTTNVLVYNNTLIDNTRNFYFSTDASYAGWSGNEIKNNISWTITAGTVHSNDYSPAGVNVAWSHNLFDDSVSGNAATNAVIDNPELSKSSGWRSLTAGELDGEEFKPSSDSAPGVDTGISISNYNDRIFASDYNGPGAISVTTETDLPPDIGAFMIDVSGSNIRGVKFYGIKFNP